jgi:hypothetical protein
MHWLRKLVAPELIEAVAPHWLRKVSRARRIEKKRTKKAEHLRRRYLARRLEMEALKVRSGRLFPPQQGSRRPEWSSALPGKWSTLNGAEA